MSRIEPHRLEGLLKGPTFCIKPWVHCHVKTAGVVGACCVSNIRFGDLRRATLSEIWDGEEIRRFRVEHLSGEAVAGCESCYTMEKAGVHSMRQVANERFGRSSAGWVASTTPDGHAPLAQPVDYDIRFSNICNLKCRSCNAAASSSWYTDEVALSRRRLPTRAILRAFDTPREFWRTFGDFAADIQQIYFAGGEPMLQEEHYQVLQAMLAANRSDVIVSYNTNFSVLGFRGIDVLDLWKQLRSVHVSASLDGSWARGALLRHGLHWQDVLENREKLRRRCPHVTFGVTCTVSALNVWHLPDFHRELLEANFVGPEGFVPNILDRPGYLNTRILPTDFKRAVETRLQAHRSWLRARGHDEAARRFEAVSQYMYAEDASGRLGAFSDFCLRLDQLRGEDTLSVLPELRPLFNESSR